MAKEDIPTWIKVASGVLLFAVTIGSTVGALAWAVGKDSTAKNYIVDSLIKTDQRHDREIGETKNEVAILREQHHKSELARTRLEGKIDLSLANDQAAVRELVDIKKQFKDFSEYLMKFNYDKVKDSE